MAGSQAQSRRVNKVHNVNSLDHLNTLRSQASTAARSEASGVHSIPKEDRFPSQIKASKTPLSEMTPLQKSIYGHSGPPMIGVIAYSLSRSEKMYQQEFEQMVAAKIDHPYTMTNGFGIGSAPHNLITGSNYEERRIGDYELCSQYAKDFTPKSYSEASNMKSSGVRSEQVSMT